MRKNENKPERGRDRRKAIDLHQLSCFVSAAELGSVSAAAEAHSLSQPAITIQIGKLEEQLGVQLFYRDHVGVHVTPAGSAFLTSAKSIIAGLSSAINDLHRFQRKQKNSVRLGVTPQVARVLLTPIVEDVVRHHPEIDLVIEETHGRNLNRWLEAGDLDIALSNIKATSNLIRHEPVIAQQFHLVGLPEHVKRRDKPIRFAELDKMRLIQGAIDGSKGRRESLLRIAAQKKIHIDFELDSPVTIRKQMMQTVSACTVSLYFLFLDEIARGELAARPIQEPMLVQILYLSRRKGRQAVAAETTIYDLVKAQIEKIVQHGKHRWHPPSWPNAVSGIELI